MLREHAYDSVMERRLFSVEVASGSASLTRLDLPSRHFACLLAWDARGSSAETIAAFVEPLLRAGATYFVCWGPDCERVHDIIDEIVCHPGNDLGLIEDSVIMTTWHSSEPLREALWFFLMLSSPDETYESSTQASLAISVGSSAWAAEISEALDHPRAFTRSETTDGAG
jgi:hypothetical protein